MLLVGGCITRKSESCSSVFRQLCQFTAVKLEATNSFYCLYKSNRTVSVETPGRAEHSATNLSCTLKPGGQYSTTKALPGKTHRKHTYMFKVDKPSCQQCRSLYMCVCVLLCLCVHFLCYPGNRNTHKSLQSQLCINQKA